MSCRAKSSSLRCRNATFGCGLKIFAKLRNFGALSPSTPYLEIDITSRSSDVMPDLLEPPKKISRPRYGRRVLSLSRLAFRILILIVVAGLALGGWYLARKGFGRQWRYRVVEELHKRGVEASIQRLTLDPFRGLVARNVRIFDYKNRENTIALISEISLDINYAALSIGSRF